jgi:hypothetical protein
MGLNFNNTSISWPAKWLAPGTPGQSGAGWRGSLLLAFFLELDSEFLQYHGHDFLRIGEP